MTPEKKEGETPRGPRAVRFFKLTPVGEKAAELIEEWEKHVGELDQEKAGGEQHASENPTKVGEA